MATSTVFIAFSLFAVTTFAGVVRDTTKDGNISREDMTTPVLQPVLKYGTDATPKTPSYNTTTAAADNTKVESDNIIGNRSDDGRWKNTARISAAPTTAARNTYASQTTVINKDSEQHEQPIQGPAESDNGRTRQSAIVTSALATATLAKDVHIASVESDNIIGNRSDDGRWKNTARISAAPTTAARNTYASQTTVINKDSEKYVESDNIIGNRSDDGRWKNTAGISAAPTTAARNTYASQTTVINKDSEQHGSGESDDRRTRQSAIVTSTLTTPTLTTDVPIASEQPIQGPAESDNGRTRQSAIVTSALATATLAKDVHIASEQSYEGSGESDDRRTRQSAIATSKLATATLAKDVPIASEQPVQTSAESADVRNRQSAAVTSTLTTPTLTTDVNIAAGQPVRGSGESGDRRNPQLAAATSTLTTSSLTTVVPIAAAMPIRLDH